MKKLITLLILFVGMVSTVMATDWYVAGPIAGGWVYDPINQSKAILMTESSTMSGIYYYDFESGTEQDETFFITDGDGNDWNDLNTNHRYALGEDGGTYTITGNKYDLDASHGNKTAKFAADGSSTYRIVFDATNKKISLVKQAKYIIAGAYGKGEDIEASFFGTAWANNLEANVLTMQDNGTYAITFNGAQLHTTAKKIYCKILNFNTWTGTTLTDGIETTVSTPYTYDIKFEFWLDNLNYCNCSMTETAISDFYVYGGLGTGDWSLSATAMDKESGVYSVEFDKPSTTNYYRFALAPNTIIKDGVVFNTSRLVRPSCGKKADWVLNTFVNINDYWVTTDTDQGDAWQFPTSMSECDWAFSYDSNELKWSVAPSFTRNISAGYATFSSAYDVAVDGATAYYCTGIDGSKELVMSTFSDGIPAGQGALLQGSGDVTFTPAASTPSTPGTNWLKPGDGDYVEGVEGDPATHYNYILTNKTVNNENAPIKFYKANHNPVAVGKAYLQIPNNIEARDFFWFGDETTGIEAAKAAQKMNGEFFNLAGQRVAQPTKGLYIVNGKKVIMK